MSAQPTTPTSTSMFHIIVPTFVSLFGPQFSRLPDELILEIFKQIATTMFPPGSRFNEIIIPATFAILNRHYAINRIRGVSRGFATLFIKITTAQQLLVFCPAARQLHDLCDSILGFGNLTFLGLHIRTDFRHYAVDDEFLRAVESGNFVITASKVELIVTDNAGFVTAEHEEVKKRIMAK
ncbi:hypothetical protein SLS59_009607 [Nothophoma quercina]|uniref:F-box domain-containing protein n=1 Tax=Nothophoma quercina TaxID=749835 RepID=A0ABR3QLK1_9PLEO